MDNQFSVYQWFENGSYEAVVRFVGPEEAVKVAVGIVHSVGGQIGTTQKVIITDGGDFTVWEWQYGLGLVFPAMPPEAN
jgi:hypothetical protein